MPELKGFGLSGILLLGVKLHWLASGSEAVLGLHFITMGRIPERQIMACKEPESPIWLFKQSRKPHIWPF